jgi:hypothetical protein
MVGLLSSMIPFSKFHIQGHARECGYFSMYALTMKMTIAIDNHIFAGTASNNCEGASSGIAVPPVASVNESTLPMPLAMSSSAGSLSFLLNADSVEVDTQLSIHNRPVPSSSTG